MRWVRLHARLWWWIEEESPVSIKRRRFSRMDLHSTRHALSIHIYDSASIFELFATVEPDKLGSFFSVSSSPSTPCVSAIPTRDNRKQESDSSYTLTGFFGQRVLPLPFVYRRYKPMVEAVEEA
jgi:hypothetical protein